MDDYAAGHCSARSAPSWLCDASCPVVPDPSLTRQSVSCSRPASGDLQHLPVGRPTRGPPSSAPGPAGTPGTSILRDVAGTTGNTQNEIPWLSFPQPPTPGPTKGSGSSRLGTDHCSGDSRAGGPSSPPSPVSLRE